MRNIHPAPSPGNNPRKPVPLVVNAAATIFGVESAMIAFLPPATAATATTTSAATASPAYTHCGKNPRTLHADQPIQHYQRQAIELRDEGPASTLEELAPPPPGPPTIYPPRPAPYMRYRLSKPDPLVLAMVLRCGCNEAKMSSPTGMLHSTPSTDEQRYLPKTRLPVVPDYSAKLLLPILGPRILSLSRLFIGGSTRARPRTCAFLECQRWARERRVPTRCHSVDRTTAPGPKVTVPS